MNRNTTLAIIAALGAALFSALAVSPAEAVTTYGTGTCDATSHLERMKLSTQIQVWGQVRQQSLSSAQTIAAQNLRAGMAYVNNNTGAIVLNVSGKLLGGGVNYQQMTAAPVVMAFYDPQTAVGRIWVDRAVRLPNNHLLLQQLPIGPQDGVLFAGAFMGTNPFWQFIQGRNGNPTVSSPYSFVKTGANAFYTAVSLVMKRFGATQGWIATMSTSSQTSTSSSGGWFSKKTTTTVTYYAKPNWTLVVPSGTVPNGYTVNYALPVCNPATQAPITASTASAAKTAVQTWISNQAQGAPSSVSYNGQIWGALNVPAGMAFIDAGTNPAGLDTSKWQVYQHSESSSGITGIGSLALNLFTGGGYTAYVWASSGGKAALNVVNTSINSSTLNLLSNFSGNKYNQQYSFSSGSKNAAGGGSVVAYNLSGYLNRLGTQHASSGVSSSKYSANPNVFGGWTGVIGVMTNVVSSNQLQAPNAIGAQANKAMDGVAKIPGGSPASATKQYTNGQATSPYGVLPLPPS